MSKIITGIKPTGRLHLGNYFGVIAPILELQQKLSKDDELYVFLADLHAFTQKDIQKDPAQYHKFSYHMALDLLSLGVDPTKIILYRHSDFPQTTEMMWFFNCMLTLPYLQRSHAYKDLIQKGEEVNIGTLTYPTLMAADILIADIDFVLVGKDQEQHLEIAREIARKFNSQYGDTFIEPQPHPDNIVVSVQGTDGQKMSKSYNNTIPIFADEAEIEKKVMQIKTDSVSKGQPLNPDTCNVFALYQLFNKKDVGALREKYLSGAIGYQEAKQILLEQILKHFSEARAKRETLLLDTELLETAFGQNRDKLNKEFDEMLVGMKTKMGLIFNEIRGDSGVLQ